MKGAMLLLVSASGSYVAAMFALGQAEATGGQIVLPDSVRSLLVIGALLLILLVIFRVARPSKGRLELEPTNNKGTRGRAEAAKATRGRRQPGGRRG